MGLMTLPSLRSRPSTRTCSAAHHLGCPQKRDMELFIETGDAPMPRSRPVKLFSEGELTELRTQLVDLLDRGWI